MQVQIYHHVHQNHKTQFNYILFTEQTILYMYIQQIMYKTNLGYNQNQFHKSTYATNN